MTTLQDARALLAIVDDRVRAMNGRAKLPRFCAAIVAEVAGILPRLDGLLVEAEHEAWELHDENKVPPRPRKCTWRGCGGPMPVDCRRDAKFCSEPCRLKAHRDRHSPQHAYRSRSSELAATLTAKALQRSSAKLWEHACPKSPGATYSYEVNARTRCSLCGATPPRRTQPRLPFPEPQQSPLLFDDEPTDGVRHHFYSGDRPIGDGDDARDVAICGARSEWGSALFEGITCERCRVLFLADVDKYATFGDPVREAAPRTFICPPIGAGVCRYCSGQGKRCSWCGAVPSACTCEQGVDAGPEEGSAPLPVPFVRAKHPWWRCDPCNGSGRGAGQSPAIAERITVVTPAHAIPWCASKSATSSTTTERVSVEPSHGRRRPPTPTTPKQTSTRKQERP